MKRIKCLLVPASLFGVIGAVLITGFGWLPAHAVPPVTGAAQTSNVVATVTAAAPVAASAERRHLTGAELYSIHCNRCHQERYPTERTGAQWKTIMLHMQVRANIPVQQARLILKYLQDNSGR